MQRNRKWFVCYPPNYKPGDGYVEVKTKKAMWRVLCKLGAGASADECKLQWNRDGGYSTFGTGKVFTVREE